MEDLVALKEPGTVLACLTVVAAGPEAIRAAYPHLLSQGSPTWQKSDGRHVIARFYRIFRARRRPHR